MDARDDFFASLRHPAVRDLAWLLGSAALLQPLRFPIWDDHDSSRIFDDAKPLLHALEHDPAPLMRHLALRPVKRLGYYVENLLGFAFAHLPGWRIVAEHWAIRDGGHTIGELDFLLQPANTDGLLHLECAYKLFLQYQPALGIQGFIGPGARDRLHLKLDKLLLQQLPLSQRPEVTRQIEAPIAERRAWLKGWLFYPFGRQPQLPAELSPAHPHGWWQHLGPARTMLRQSGSRWAVLPRLRWIAPARLDPPATPLDGPQMSNWLEQHYFDKAIPQLLVELAPCEHGWLEIGRGFVVGDNWPFPTSA